jgi:hypothetical protein
MVWCVAVDGKYLVYPRFRISSGNRIASRHYARNWPILGEKGPWLRPQQERCRLSFASEPERDDGSLPPVNIVIPDDARELERDVLAYRREMRVKRRRQRLLRLVQPFNRSSALGGPAAIVPLVALCLALALVGGALLSVVTMNPADAPVVSSTPTSPQIGQTGLTVLPTGNVVVAGRSKPVRSLAGSVLALVPADCGCGQELDRLAGQAVAAGVPLYFVGTGSAASSASSAQQLAAETAQYGRNHAIAADDAEGVLAGAYRPDGLTVLLAYSTAKTEVRRHLGTAFQLGPQLSELKSGGAQASAQSTPQVAPAGALAPAPAHRPVDPGVSGVARTDTISTSCSGLPGHYGCNEGVDTPCHH